MKLFVVRNELIVPERIGIISLPLMSEMKCDDIVNQQLYVSVHRLVLSFRRLTSEVSIKKFREWLSLDTVTDAVGVNLSVELEYWLSKLKAVALRLDERIVSENSKTNDP